MMNSDDLNRLIPITQFNKGQASRIFDRLKEEKQLIVLKNNVPSAVLLSPEEYTRLTTAAQGHQLQGQSAEHMDENELMQNATSMQF